MSRHNLVPQKRFKGTAETLYSTPFSSVALNEETAGNAFTQFFKDSNTVGQINGPEASLTKTFTTRFDNKSLITDLGVLMVGLVARDLSFINKVVFPLVFTNDLTFQSRIIEFLPNFPVATPALGVSRTFAFREEQKISQSKRYGTHFRMEADQFDTEEGREQFAINMQRMVESLKENYAWVAWSTLIQPHPLKLHNDLSKVRLRAGFIEALRQEVREFASPHKTLGGLYAMVKLYNSTMKQRTGVGATCVIVPEDKMVLLTSLDLNQHNVLGDRGVDMIVGSGEVASISGVKVFSAPTFSPGFLEAKESPLNTEIRIGRYHPFINRHRHHCQLAGGILTFDYNKYMVDKIFNINTNRRDHLNFKRCNEADGRWNKDAGAGDKHFLDKQAHKDNKGEDLFRKGDSVPKVGAQDWYEVGEAQQTLSVFEKFIDPLFIEGLKGIIISGSNEVKTKLWATQSTATPVTDVLNLQLTRELVSFAYDERVPPPWGFLLFQPFDGYRMQTMVFVAPEAGLTYVTDPNFSMGEDAVNQSYYFGCTAYAGVHTHDENRIILVHNQFYNGIISGGNTTLISPTEADSLKDDNFRPANDDVDRPSLYVCSIPYKTLEENMLNEEFIDITGRAQVDAQESEVHWPGAEFYGKVYGFNRLSAPYSLTNQRDPIARICYQMHAEVIDHSGNGWCDIEGQGHHGKYERVGARDTRSTGHAFNPDVQPTRS
jgi:hypothetical protein